jgi:putative ABC transport system ATP-binding protein
LLEQVGLGSRLHHRPAELSGGEQQRVAIARALVHEPALLLADEPTGNLDGESARAIVPLLRSLAQRRSAALLIATHDPALARVADRVLELLDGRLQSSSKAEARG